MSLNRAHYDKSNDKKGTNDNNQYYNKKNDPEAKYFDGTFTNGVENNGSVWKRKNSSSKYDTKIG